MRIDSVLAIFKSHPCASKLVIPFPHGIMYHPCLRRWNRALVGNNIGGLEPGLFDDLVAVEVL